MHFGQFRKVLGLVLQLGRCDTFTYSFSFTVALAAIGQLSLLQLGKSIHSEIVKFGVECIFLVAKCLINVKDD